MALLKKTITLKRVTEERAKKQEDKTWEAKSEKSTTISKEESAPSSTIKYDPNDKREPIVYTYDFGAALSLLKNGKRMARKCWKPGRYIQMSTPTRKSFIGSPFLFYYSASSHSNVVWIPDNIDLFANDWIEFVEEAHVG